MYFNTILSLYIISQTCSVSEAQLSSRVLSPSKHDSRERQHKAVVSSSADLSQRDPTQTLNMLSRRRAGMIFPQTQLTMRVLPPHEHLTIWKSNSSEPLHSNLHQFMSIIRCQKMKQNGRWNNCEYRWLVPLNDGLHTRSESPACYPDLWEVCRDKTICQIYIYYYHLYCYAYINILAHSRFVHDENFSSISKKNRTISSTDYQSDSVIL